MIFLYVGTILLPIIDASLLLICKQCSSSGRGPQDAYNTDSPGPGEESERHCLDHATLGVQDGKLNLGYCITILVYGWKVSLQKFE